MALPTKAGTLKPGLNENAFMHWALSQSTARSNRAESAGTGGAGPQNCPSSAVQWCFSAIQNTAAPIPMLWHPQKTAEPRSLFSAVNETRTHEQGHPDQSATPGRRERQGFSGIPPKAGLARLERSPIAMLLLQHFPQPCLLNSS